MPVYAAEGAVKGAVAREQSRDEAPVELLAKASAREVLAETPVLLLLRIENS